MKRKRLQDLPIWRGDFEAGEQAVWIWHNEDLPWPLRYAAQRIMLDHAFSSRERCIAQLIKGGWMVQDEKGIRSVVPGKKSGWKKK